jgi:hypothetical protein
MCRFLSLPMKSERSERSGRLEARAVMRLNALKPHTQETLRRADK